ncbi:hypothetical protein GCM10027403_08470 [Arthrobacter tecti]
MTDQAGPPTDLPNWDDRSWVTANMLNPAVIAVIIVSAANMYEEHSGDPMPWELIFLAVPMALHRDTRESLPTRINSYAAKWVYENATLQASFPGRISGMLPYSREGLRYALRSGALTLVNDGRLRGTPQWKLHKERDRELAIIIGKAAFLGRWFAHTGTPATLFALFGVAP